MQQFLKIMTVLTITLVVCSFAQAADLFVSNEGGDDRNDGTTASRPFKTISRALRGAKRGDRIVLEKTATPYEECISLSGARHSGTPERPFEIVGNGATLNGLGSISEDAWEHKVKNIYRFEPTYSTNQILFLDGKPLKKGTQTDILKMAPMTWIQKNNYLYFSPEKGKLPFGYDLKCCKHGTGITLYQVRNVVISDLVVEGFRSFGVNVVDTASGVNLVGLTVRGNGRAGINVGGASRVKVSACLVGSNSKSQIRTEGFCKTLVENCDLVESPTAQRIHQTGGRISIDDKWLKKGLK